MVAAWPMTVIRSRWPRLHPQDAEAAVLVVEGHSLDEAGEILTVG
jgi:hypothetical protein